MERRDEKARLWQLRDEFLRSTIEYYLAQIGTLSGAARYLGVAKSYLSKLCKDLAIDVRTATKGPRVPSEETSEPPAPKTDVEYPAWMAGA